MVKVYYKSNGKSVTLYDCNRDADLTGTLYLLTNNTVSYLRLIAVSALLTSLLGFSLFTLPLVISQFRYLSLKPASNFHSVVASQDLSSTPQPTLSPVPTPIPQEFQITIPKINVVSKVITNVDPSNSQEYEAVLLSEGVAHAKGSYLPGEKGPVVLFAHSTDSLVNVLQFNAQFFAVKELEEGDEIVINYNNQTYRYFVASKKVVAPEDLAAIQTSSEDLVLSTCWPPGTNWQRLLVFAKKAP